MQRSFFLKQLLTYVGQWQFKHKVHSIFERVGHDDAPSVRKQNHATEFRTLFFSQEFFRHNCELSFVVPACFFLHVLFKLLFAAHEHLLNHILFPFAYFDFNIIFKKPYHSLDYQLLNSLLVAFAWGLHSCNDAGFGLSFELLETLVTARHFLYARLVCLRGLGDLLVYGQIVHFIFEVLQKHSRSVFNLLVSLVFVDSLA